MNVFCRILNEPSLTFLLHRYPPASTIIGTTYVNVIVNKAAIDNVFFRFH